MTAAVVQNRWSTLRVKGGRQGSRDSSSPRDCVIAAHWGDASHDLRNGKEFAVTAAAAAVKVPCMCGKNCPLEYAAHVLRSVKEFLMSAVNVFQRRVMLPFPCSMARIEFARCTAEKFEPHPEALIKEQQVKDVQPARRSLIAGAASQKEEVALILQELELYFFYNSFRYTSTDDFDFVVVVVLL